jgi:hypothetical protein
VRILGLRQLAQYQAKVNPQVLGAQQDSLSNNGLQIPFTLAGAPTSGAGGSFNTRAVVGSRLVDTTAGKLHICTAVGGGSVTWVVVGSQV